MPKQFGQWVEHCILWINPPFDRYGAFTPASRTAMIPRIPLMRHITSTYVPGFYKIPSLHRTSPVRVSRFPHSHQREHGDEVLLKRQVSSTRARAIYYNSALKSRYVPSWPVFQQAMRQSLGETRRNLERLNTGVWSSPDPRAEIVNVVFSLFRPPESRKVGCIPKSWILGPL